VTTSDDRELQQRFQRIESLLRDVEKKADPAVLAGVQDIVQTLLEFHAAGLQRLLDLLGPEDAQRVAREELISSLLLLHGLHPLGLEARIRQALDSVRPMLRSHGGEVELVRIVDGSVFLRLQGSCHGCGSSTHSLRQALEQAVLGIAPDVAGLEIDTPEESREPATTFIPLEQVHLNGHTTKEAVS
jgi:Fe-S cluster biogenesis protein NfuA